MRKRMDSGRPRSLHDHMTAGGDQVVGELRVICRASGCLEVHGPIENKEWALAVLENAKDAIRNYHTKSEIVVPGKDVTIPL